MKCSIELLGSRLREEESGSRAGLRRHRGLCGQGRGDAASEGRGLGCCGRARGGAVLKGHGRRATTATRWRRRQGRRDLGTWWLSFSDGRCGQRRVDEARLLGLV
ncbi:hypothetical protein M0R45_035683 [Rubus argutus]|uniref:Uncharacterized protein n=1 Tax=Rubus argutus TaxID=59490 RepID=A0AAW1VWQ7_RUBAR